VDKMQFVMAMMVASDPHWHENRPNPSRQMTAEELDAVADYGWQFPALKRFLAGWSNAVHERWREASRERNAKPTLASVDAT
jgi:hypothetical protein